MKPRKCDVIDQDGGVETIRSIAGGSDSRVPSTSACHGSFPCPPHNHSGSVGNKADERLESAQIARCSASMVPG